MPLTILDGPIILAGESLSDELDCTAGTIVRITMPMDWTPANITFQFSSAGGAAGGGYNDMFDGQGNEVTLPNFPPGCGIVLTHIALATLAWIKIRSGTRTHPVKQAANRLFSIALQTP